ncbi:MAG: PadR family transcriptional regulator, partial [Gammaproteobacteria bacterium]|nr:PadR family transcriptional regulator [Gemmatimonadota bacterium]NIU79721.1 PadR family transcriptional regulator [Gammaproteobacteria bacterium]
GWIEELDDAPEGESERKRFYRLTGTGRQALEEEAARLAGVAVVARERLA